MASLDVLQVQLVVLFISSSFVDVQSKNIDLAECPPPDYPRFGWYGPTQSRYLPGDTINYFCDVDTYIGGNYLRVCKDTGDWTGNTPVCDARMVFEEVNQSSTAEPIQENDAEKATDDDRRTCSSTEAGPGATWTATFAQACHLLRFMLYLPKGNLAYETISIRADGAEFSCGKSIRRNDQYGWVFHNCLSPNNTNIVAVKIQSLSDEPLQLCEVVTHALTDPTCVDPHVFIPNGRLILTRKRASLVCQSRYRPSRQTTLKCIRTGEWERKNLYCENTSIEVDDPNSDDSWDEGDGP